MNIGSNTNFATNGGKTNPLNNPIVAGDLTTKDIIDLLLTSASKSFSGGCNQFILRILVEPRRDPEFGPKSRYKWSD